MLREHALLPALVVALSAALAALGCAVAGALPEHGAAVALAAIAVTPARDSLRAGCRRGAAAVCLRACS